MNHDKVKTDLSHTKPGHGSKETKLITIITKTITNNMKQTQLTVFDWVVFDGFTTDGVGEPIQAQIKELGEIISCQRGDEVFLRKIDDLFPIVVIDDDLIRNGFKFRQVTNLLKDFSLEKRTKTEGEAEEVTTVSIRMQDDDTTSYDICIEKHLEWEPGQRKNILHFERWGLLYVNELQHYLREAGFEELANNFKMED